MVASTKYGDQIEEVGVYSRDVSDGLHSEILPLLPF